MCQLSIFPAFHHIQRDTKYAISKVLILFYRRQALNTLFRNVALEIPIHIY